MTVYTQTIAASFVTAIKSRSHLVDGTGVIKNVHAHRLIESVKRRKLNDPHRRGGRCVFEQNRFRNNTDPRARTHYHRESFINIMYTHTQIYTKRELGVSRCHRRLSHSGVYTNGLTRKLVAHGTCIYIYVYRVPYEKISIEISSDITKIAFFFFFMWLSQRDIFIYY